ncbi:hypothetical protein [Streptomyces sp. PR69]|uniref:hypothetical protein n=1 Tax=Streptomyces sp. PR69 TaxID=2984950 RepID=UPI00226551E4|nr:hypothetical protein [Streptomyces sp. PR69]
MPQTRPSAGAPRLLWTAIALFAFLYAHGVSADAAVDHLAAGPAVAAASAHGHTSQSTPPDRRGPADRHDEGHGHSHAAEECVPGQPQQGPALDAPSACALPCGQSAAAARPAVACSGDVASAAGQSPPRMSLKATVLQI